MAALPEQFSLVGESLQRMLPHGEQLAQSLQAAVAQTVPSEAAPPPALAMEVATAIQAGGGELDPHDDQQQHEHPGQDQGRLRPGR